MSDLFEMNDIVVDSFARELRIGDEIVLADEVGDIRGKVSGITKPEGQIRETAEGATVSLPPIITVQLGTGVEIEVESQFIRSVVWRWHAMGLQRA